MEKFLNTIRDLPSDMPTGFKKVNLLSDFEKDNKSIKMDNGFYIFEDSLVCVFGCMVYTVEHTDPMNIISKQKAPYNKLQVFTKAN
jgi:uncharacterized protein YutD